MFFDDPDRRQVWRREANDDNTRTMKTASGTSPSRERLDLVEANLSRNTLATMVAACPEKVEPTLSA
jgi:hypothetical protein